MHHREKQTFFIEKFTFFRSLGEADKKRKMRDFQKESRMVNFYSWQMQDFSWLGQEPVNTPV